MNPILSQQFEEILQSNMPVNLVLGIGGHSGAAWVKAFLANRNINHVVVFNSFDSGGDTGNKIEATGQVPQGDPKNTLMHLFEALGDQHLQNVAHLMVDRVSTFEELRNRLIAALKELLLFSNEEFDVREDEVIDFLLEVERRYNLLPENLKYNKHGEFINHNVGNALLMFLNYRFGGINEMFFALKNIGAIPQNVYFASMSDDEATELIAEKDENGERVVSEREIDEWTERISLFHYYLSVRGDQTLSHYEPKNKFIQEIIKIAKVINFPPGSPENWAVLAKIYQEEILDAIRNNGSQLLAWGNVSTTPNSYGVTDMILYLYSLYGDSIKFLLPTAPDGLMNEHALEALKVSMGYITEGKRLQFYGLETSTEFVKTYNILREKFNFDLPEGINDIYDLWMRISQNLFGVGCINLYYYHNGSIKQTVDIPLINGQLHIVKGTTSLDDVNRGFKHNADYVRMLLLALFNDEKLSKELIQAVEGVVNEEFERLNGGAKPQEISLH